VTLHNFLPLLALILNVFLAGITLFRNPESRLNRLFTYFVGGMAVWNFGVFMLRRAPDETTAVFWEVVIHTGVIALPAFYYHFVLIFLERTTRHRTSLLVAYTLALVFSIINLSGSTLFMHALASTALRLKLCLIRSRVRKRASTSSAATSISKLCVRRKPNVVRSILRPRKN